MSFFFWSVGGKREGDGYAYVYRNVITTTVLNRIEGSHSGVPVLLGVKFLLLLRNCFLRWFRLSVTSIRRSIEPFTCPFIPFIIVKILHSLHEKHGSAPFLEALLPSFLISDH